MSHIEIYTTMICPYCDRAKALLKNKGLTYHEIDVSHDYHIRMEMVERAKGQRTVPQIFINNQHIGGYTELYALNQSGKLDEILQNDRDSSL